MTRRTRRGGQGGRGARGRGSRGALGERLGEHIDETRKDWEAKKADAGVPGAAGAPGRAEEGGEHPETEYPAKGDAD